MKSLILGGLSVLAMSFASIPAAEAFTSVTNSSISRANYRNHSLNLEVDRYNLTGLNIALPEQIREIDEVQILNQAGEIIAADTTISEGLVSVQFNQAVSPGNEFNLKFRGVDGSYGQGDTLSYQISAQKEGLSQTIPLRAARVSIPDVN